MSNFNPFTVAQHQPDDAARLLNLEPDIHQILCEPSRELHVTIPVRMDDGSTHLFRGFRVQYNDALGPTKGGIRFHPAETIDTVRALAAWMTWKCSLLALPLGGGKGGVVCNPKRMSDNELELLCRGYIDQVHRLIGPDTDVPAPDVYTNAQMMAWMMDEYSKFVGHSEFGMITGKPLVLGGSAGRDDATARGGIYVVREAAKTLKLDLTKSAVAIQGFGNAGCHFAKLAVSLLGARVVAVSDSQGGAYNPDGIDPAALEEYKKESGSVASFPGSQPISNEQLLELDVQVLVPAALEHAITGANAPRIKAKILAELANGPTTPDADGILFRNGVHVLPDFLCNAGGVTVSYFEMVQNAERLYWEEEEVHEKLDHKMSHAYAAVLHASQLHEVNMRQAAYMLAVARVAEAVRARGKGVGSDRPHVIPRDVNAWMRTPAPANAILHATASATHSAASPA